MLAHSFIFLRGIGPSREFSLWKRGVHTWDDFVAEREISHISPERKAEMDSQLEIAAEHLRAKDSGYFATRLPSREMWRCYGDFLDRVAYLDIETTGISSRSPVTVVGVYDGSRMHTLVRGMNLTSENLLSILTSVKMIVTFNGSSFDLPVLSAQFPQSIPHVPHLDLRHILRRTGHAGGLKTIERELGIERDRRVEYMTGEDAAYLWKMWERHGKKNALDLLVEYNTEDCRNLKTLAKYSYNRMKSSTFDKVLNLWKD